MREKLLAKLREQKEILDHAIFHISAETKWDFERDYFMLTSQRFVINDLIEAILKGEFDD